MTIRAIPLGAILTDPNGDYATVLGGPDELDRMKLLRGNGRVFYRSHGWLRWCLTKAGWSLTKPKRKRR